MEASFWTEKDGTPSSMRINSSLLVWGGIIVLLFTVVAPLIPVTIETGTNITIGFGMIGTGITGKVAQKFGEK